MKQKLSKKADLNEHTIASIQQKNKVWIVNVPKKLDLETRQHANAYDISLSNFVKKSVRYLLTAENPAPSQKKYAQWIVSVHHSLDKDMKILAKANYPCISSLIRYAVTRQIIEEQLELEQQKRRQSLLEENWRLRKELKQLKKIYKIPKNFLAVKSNKNRF